MRHFFCFLLCLFLFQTATYAQWHPIEIDSTKQKWGDWAEPEWLRYFGQDAADVDRDGDLDILSGRYVYHNPGGDMTAPWPRTALDDNVDGILLMDVDGDVYADIIAQALPDLLWYEALDEAGTRYRRRVIAQVPATSHVNSQGFERAQIVAGGQEEIIIAGDGDLYVVEVPEAPQEQPWPTHLVAANTSDEGIGVGDIDGDGDLDLAAGRRPDGEDEPKIVVWYRNPGSVAEPWAETVVGEGLNPIDRVGVADLNGDARADIVVTEERYPGEEPDGNLWWYEQPAAPEGTWKRHRIVTQYSMNNLDLADLDGDGDVDLITNEHKGPKLELQLWENDGAGNFSKKMLDQGKENHLGTQLADLDGDGDLDLFGGAWDKYEHVYVWRNDTIKSAETGAVFREYPWWPQAAGNDDKFLRVGGKLDYASDEGDYPASAQQDGWLPLEADVVLEGATHAELIIERVQSHEDTKDLQVRLNDSEWMAVPEPARIPGPRTDYMFHSNLRIPIPLTNLKSGKDNVFRFRVGEEQRWNWPQNLVYGLVLRVYYFSDELPKNLRLTGIVEGDTLGNEVSLSLSSPTDLEVTKVEYVGLYKDVNWQGDGIYRQWQYNFHRGRVRNHIGTATEAPFAVKWNTEWVPDQSEPVRLSARVHLRSGLVYRTPAVNNLPLVRNHSVYLVKPDSPPTAWATRSGEFSQHFMIPFDPSKATAARIYWNSWSPCYSAGLQLNGHTLPEADKGDCYAAEQRTETIQNMSALQAGNNTLTTNKTPLHEGQMVHGMEVQYPGFMLKIKRPAAAKKKVSINETTYEDRPHFMVATPAATYYYDQRGGGFSRIIDPNGNDWVGFRMEPWNAYPASAASAYRGLPNSVFGGSEAGAGHPGHDHCQSVVDRNQITSTSQSGKWRWTWTFTDSTARLQMDEVDAEHPYWFLYEGTPGGRFDVANSYYGTDQSGRQQNTPDFYAGKSTFDSFRWAYFGDAKEERVFFVKQLSEDEQKDMIGYLGNTERGLDSPDGMVVFGFGRNRDTQPLLTQPQSFVIGFYPHCISDPSAHRRFAQWIEQIN